MNYVFLTEKDEMWAKMLMEILKNHKIPCSAVPVHGAGVAVRAGIPEQLKIYVPESQRREAEELTEELFSNNRNYSGTASTAENELKKKKPRQCCLSPGTMRKNGNICGKI